jgi:VWFA-related protein
MGRSPIREGLVLLGSQLAQRPCWRAFLPAALALIFGALANSGYAQAAPDSAASNDQNQAVFKLRVESNLVVIRAVVRDAQGNDVQNLRKEDFRIFEGGKEQIITQFATETRATGTTSVAANQTQSSGLQSSPNRFLALYFDDLDMPSDDIQRARAAADRYLAASLGPTDRAAIFTSSGSVHADFTSELKQLHEALLKLRPSSRVGAACPALSDYQAELIVKYDPNLFSQTAATTSAIPSASMGRGLGGSKSASQSVASPAIDAIALAAAECNLGAQNSNALAHIVYMQSENLLSQTRWQAQYSLAGLSDVVNHIAEMPGQRNIVLISSGFLTSDLSPQIETIVDHALRSQVVISSIDSTGLSVMSPEFDVRYGSVSAPAPIDNPHLMAAKRDLTFNREQAALSVLEEMAEDTGGKFFHNDNDINLGLKTVTTLSETSYILAFAPKDLKPDGRFHSLKVTLRDKRGGVTLQARKGYFAPVTGTNPADQLAESIRAAVLSTVEMRDLPLHVITETSRSAGKDAAKTELAVMTRLEVGPVHFRKDGEHYLNTLTFVASIFDHNGLWVGGEQKQVSLDLSDAQLRQLLLSPGVLVRSAFQLAPGTYSVREVVMDSENHHIGAITRSVEVPDFHPKSAASSSTAGSLPR